LACGRGGHADGAIRIALGDPPDGRTIVTRRQQPPGGKPPQTADDLTTSELFKAAELKSGSAPAVAIEGPKAGPAGAAAEPLASDSQQLPRPRSSTIKTINPPRRKAAGGSQVFDRLEQRRSDLQQDRNNGDR
jgi:hypothetical protein